jgi:NTE family protein
MTLGIILSGGGARGAYEAGVLRYVFETFPGAPYTIIAGTSVGAFNSAFLASVAEDPAAGVARLYDLWSSIELSQVFRFGLCEVTDLHRVVLGGKGEIGALDVGPLAELVERAVPWERLRSNIDSGRISALTVSATHVSTGQTHIFVDHAPSVSLLRRLVRHAVACEETIEPAHVLASSAIPVLFPPVRIHDALYCEGGLRLNTPVSPAIRLGADRLLVVAVSTPPGQQRPASVRPGWTPGLSFLLGKVLNAFLLDHVIADLGHLEEINELLRGAARLYGESFLQTLARDAEAPRRIIRPLVLRPSVDIGSLAGDYLRRHRVRFDRIVERSLLRLLEVGEGEDADLASYLLFDSIFLRQLLELGRSDAQRRRDELEAFLFSPEPKEAEPWTPRSDASAFPRPRS